MSGIICQMSNCYTYKGVSFEFHHYCGPWPLKKDGDLKKYAGKKFWDLWEEFALLPEDEQKKYLTFEGGCYAL